MTKKSSRIWLVISAVLTIISLILIIVPVTTKKELPISEYRDSRIPRDSIFVVTRVIDGDTYVLSDSIHVRLIGIDTPEKGQPFYSRAKDFADSVLTGAAVSLKFGREMFDKYGRRLVYLYLDSLLINQELLNRGLASVYLFRENDENEELLIEAQNTARSGKRGIWSLPEPEPEDYYFNTTGSYRFHRPLCPHLKNADQKRLRKYTSRDKALDNGLSPCRFCRP